MEAFNCLNDETDYDGDIHILHAKDDSSNPWCFARIPDEVSAVPYSFDVRIMSEKSGDARIGIAFNVESTNTFEMVYFNIE